GQGKGRFAAGEMLKDRDGKVIKLGSASTAFAADWLGTGRLDLLVGTIEGDVWLLPNEGTKTSFAFGKARKLEVDGQPIRVNHGDSHPVAADWDKDGKLDLVVGTGAGGVLWYRNVGVQREPKLAAPVTLVADGEMGVDPKKAAKDRPWGGRAKVCVTDWNGDGWPDLLVGDFGLTMGDPPKLTDEDRKAQQEIQSKYSKVIDQFMP